MSHHPVVQGLAESPTINDDGTYKNFLISETWSTFVETPVGIILTLIYDYYYNWWYSIIWVICGPVMNLMAMILEWDVTKIYYN